MQPTNFQKKMFWAALTALSIVAVAAVVTLVGWLVVSAISFLQPVLIPLAVAAILAYLLEPVVRFLVRLRIPRTLAVILVFVTFIAAGVGVAVSVVPAIWEQGKALVTGMPEKTAKAQALLDRSVTEVRKMLELPMFHKAVPGEPPPDLLTGYVAKAIEEGAKWLQDQAPGMLLGLGKWIQSSAGGVLGVFGMLLTLVLVPIFLFFFLKEGPAISGSWTNYLPLRASPLKSEIVFLLSEINSYLINFFRGQLLVSMISGLLTGTALLILGLDFALVIGLAVAILGLIPYAGFIISLIPAIVIAAAQFNDWLHPVLVLVIFLIVNNLEGLFVSPKIVGESVGLHPLTVIISVLAWSIVFGGLLGALLAVPLTATLKVLLKRYFWDRPPENLPLELPLEEIPEPEPEP